MLIHQHPQSLGEGYSQGLLIPCHFWASEVLESPSGTHADGKIPGKQVVHGERLLASGSGPSPLPHRSLLGVVNILQTWASEAQRD